ncbi:MAG: SGNH/GDSL hydrolase family protein [Elusimicrobia bacterium]|nr:SGNH/GDSL hydrolase family protein [Elusimicrobiota bacterium]
MASGSPQRSDLVLCRLALAGGAMLAGLLAFETGARLFVEHSDRCWGLLWGRELPPLRFPVGLEEGVVAGPGQRQDIVVKGRRIEAEDLWGVFDRDPELGYAPRENAASPNGWWRSNNIGARSGSGTAKAVPPGRRRVLVFGDSFTNCSRAPQEETWPHFLNAGVEGVEFVNLGVDGYSMGQCLLRYERVRARVDHDAVMLVFVPTEDPWREVNVYRGLAGWQASPPMPRFVVKDGGLELVKSPYRSYEDFRKDNSGRLSSRFIAHERAYDRFYFRTKYESPPLVGGSILYKLLARAWYRSREMRLAEDMMRPGSEAVSISLGVIRRMKETAEREGVRFVLVFLPQPEDMERYRSDLAFRGRYDGMAAAAGRAGAAPLDLMKGFLEARPEKFDRGYDGTHYGPKANKLISESLRKVFP